MTNDPRVVDLAAKRGRSAAALRERLLKAYRDAREADDGRRVPLRDLPGRTQLKEM
jgi:hypothetical protein